jgi:hypothetical protein
MKRVSAESINGIHAVQYSLKDVSPEQFLHFVEKTGSNENMFRHRSHSTVNDVKSFLHISRVLQKK